MLVCEIYALINYNDHNLAKIVFVVLRERNVPILGVTDK